MLLVSNKTTASPSLSFILPEVNNENTLVQLNMVGNYKINARTIPLLKIIHIQSN